MLNKEVCMRCYKSQWNKQGDAFVNHLWKQHTMFCLHADNLQVFINTRKNPPKRCPYILEHTVNQNVK